MGAINKTPRRGNETSFTSKTPKMGQGPTLGKPNSWKSPGVGGVSTRPKSQVVLGDRMVPSRSTTDFEAAHHKMTSTDESTSGETRVLSYQTAQIPKPQEAYINHQKVSLQNLTAFPHNHTIAFSSRPFILPRHLLTKNRPTGTFQALPIAFLTPQD